MRLTLALFLIIGLLGCNHAQKKREKLAERKENERRAVHQANMLMLESLEAGISKAKLIEVFGLPDRKEFISGTYIFWYEMGGVDPMYIGVKDDKVTGWMSDRETLRDRQTAQIQERQIENQERQTDAMESAASSAKWANILQGVSVVTPQRVIIEDRTPRNIPLSPR